MGGLLAAGSAGAGPLGMAARFVAPFVAEHGAALMGRGIDYAFGKGKKLLGNVISRWVGKDKFDTAMSGVGRVQEAQPGDIGVLHGASLGESYKEGFKQTQANNMGVKASGDGSGGGGGAVNSGAGAAGQALVDPANTMQM